MVPNNRWSEEKGGCMHDYIDNKTPSCTWCHPVIIFFQIYFYAMKYHDKVSHLTLSETYWRLACLPNENFFECHYRPVLRAEFACQLHLTIAPLVVAWSSKSGPIWAHRENFFSPTSTTFNYHQDFLEGGFYTSVAHWIRLSTPFDRSTSGCCMISAIDQ